MTSEEHQVRKFYDSIWNQHDKSAIPDIIHETFRFRGSLGIEKEGIGGFTEYLDLVHTALGNYICLIQDIVVEQPKVFAKVLFSGTHQDTFLGYAPTGKLISWQGAALFHFDNRKISSLWVLADLKSLEKQLESVNN